MKRLIASSISSNKSEFETYKIINKCNTSGGCPYHVCRVWFTLIPIKSEHLNCAWLPNTFRMVKN